MPKKISGCFLSFFLYCRFFTERNKISFAKQKIKQKTNLFSDVQNHFLIKNENVKDDERRIFEIFQKPKRISEKQFFGDIGRDCFFVQRKGAFYPEKKQD